MSFKDTINCLQIVIKIIYFSIGVFLLRLSDFSFSQVGNIIDHGRTSNQTSAVGDQIVSRKKHWNMVRGKGPSVSRPCLKLDFSGDN